MEKNLRSLLLQMVSYVAGRSEINDSARLYHDLLIAGDDAHELFEKIHRECGTTFEGFIFNSYFPNETDAIFFRLAKMFGYRYKRKELTFEHLLRVVERSHWFEPKTIYK